MANGLHATLSIKLSNEQLQSLPTPIMQHLSRMCAAMVELDCLFAKWQADNYHNEQLKMIAAYQHLLESGKVVLKRDGEWKVCEADVKEADSA